MLHQPTALGLLLVISVHGVWCVSFIFSLLWRGFILAGFLRRRLSLCYVDTLTGDAAQALCHRHHRYYSECIL